MIKYIKILSEKIKLNLSNNKKLTIWYEIHEYDYLDLETFEDIIKTEYNLIYEIDKVENFDELSEIIDNIEDRIIKTNIWMNKTKISLNDCELYPPYKYMIPHNAWIYNQTLENYVSTIKYNSKITFSLNNVKYENICLLIPSKYNISK